MKDQQSFFQIQSKISQILSNFHNFAHSLFSPIHQESINLCAISLLNLHVQVIWEICWTRLKRKSCQFSLCNLELFNGSWTILHDRALLSWEIITIHLLEHYTPSVFINRSKTNTESRAALQEGKNSNSLIHAISMWFR